MILWLEKSHKKDQSSVVEEWYIIMQQVRPLLHIQFIILFIDCAIMLLHVVYYFVNFLEKYYWSRKEDLIEQNKNFKVSCKKKQVL